MNEHNFDFLQNPNKIAIAKDIKKKYWNYYFNCYDFSTEDIDFQLRIIYQSGDNAVLTMEEYCRVIDTIENK